VRSLWPRGLVAHVARHPSCAWTLLRAGWPLRASHWWRRAPFLPVPAPGYWEFRMTTYGGAGATISPSAMIEAAEWALRQRVRE